MCGNSDLSERKIQLIQFHERLYAFSRTLKREQIKKEMFKLAKEKSIYPVRFKSVKLREFAEHEDLMREFRTYLLKIIDHYEEFFEERKLTVELSTNGTCIYLIGAKPKYLM